MSGGIFESGGSGGSSLRRQEFLVSGNFTVPDGVNFVDITGCSGGGGGHTSGGGKGGDYVIRVRIPVVAGESVPVTIGAGGIGNAIGGVTSFGSLLYIDSGNGAAAGLGASSAVGDRLTFSAFMYQFAGGASAYSWPAWYGGGGAGLFGPGTSAADAAANSGAGAGGKKNMTFTGGSGRLIVEWLA